MFSPRAKVLIAFFVAMVGSMMGITLFVACLGNPRVDPLFAVLPLAGILFLAIAHLASVLRLARSEQVAIFALTWIAGNVGTGANADESAKVAKGALRAMGFGIVRKPSKPGKPVAMKRRARHGK